MGIRKPSLKKSIKARTTGKLKRKVKKSINPFYGKRGMGLLNNPKKSIYNKVYSNTTYSVFNASEYKNNNINYKYIETENNNIFSKFGILNLIIGIISIPIFLLGLLMKHYILALFILVMGLLNIYGYFYVKKNKKNNLVYEDFNNKYKVILSTSSPDIFFENVEYIKTNFQNVNHEIINTFISKEKEFTDILTYNYFTNAIIDINYSDNLKESTDKLNKYKDNLLTYKNKFTQENIEYLSQIYESIKQDLISNNK